MRSEHGQPLTPLRASDRRELVACSARLGDIADRDKDLDVSREKRRAPERQYRLAHGSPNRPRRRVRLALGEPHQPETGLRLAPEAACLAVRSLGFVEPPLQAMDFRLPIRGVPERTLVQHALRELRRHTARFLERLPPRAAESHDLGPMHEADALVRDHVRLLLAPACQRLRPFARAPKLVRVAAEGDCVAVDDSGDYRRELTGGDGHHRLVNEPEAFLGLPLPNEGVTLLHDRERNEVRVAKLLSDRRDLAGGCVRSGELAFPGELEDGRDQEVAARDAVPDARARATAVHERTNRALARPARET